MQTRQLWSDHQDYELYYEIIYAGVEQLVILGVMPLAMLVYYNFSAYMAYKLPQDMEINPPDGTIRRSREKKMSKVLISIVTVFIFCQSTRFIWYLYYSINYKSIVNCPKQFPDTTGEHPWSYILALIYELFLVINASVNTVVYFTVNNAFRKRLLRHLTQPLISLYHFIHPLPPT